MLQPAKFAENKYECKMCGKKVTIEMRPMIDKTNKFIKNMIALQLCSKCMELKK